MDTNNSDSEIENTPPELREQANFLSLNLLPATSREKYESTYKQFVDWKKKYKTKSISENIILAYFQELSKTRKASTLWSIYLMLKLTININHAIDISTYLKLRAFLKRNSEGYSAKKAHTLTSEQVHQFIEEAPDDTYLLTKAVMVIAISGACRRSELWKLKMSDIEDLNSALLIKLNDTKTKVPRSFTITGNLYNICKKYLSLRPSNLSENRFFLNYQKGKCTRQVVGINKFGKMPQEIASFLKLPNPQFYTGHTFRRSSATMLANAGADLLTLKRHGGWRSNNVAEGYVDDSLYSKMNIANKILHEITPPTSSTNLTSSVPSTSTSTLNISKTNSPKIIIQNCSDFTVNYN